MILVSFHYWAAARAAAGMVEEAVEATSVADALTQVFVRHRNPRFERVVRVSTLLVDGVALRSAELNRVLDVDTEVEVLPPFAGG